MKPIDYRNETYAEVKPRLEEISAHVLAAWKAFGPGTTREVSARSEMSLLTFRPATTRLCQNGLVVLADEKRAREGTYRAATEAEVQAYFEERRAAALAPAVQSELPLS